MNEITEGEAKEGFWMRGGDIVRADGTCAGYTALDFQDYFMELQVRAIADHALAAIAVRLADALEKIESGWKSPPGPGMRPPPEPLGKDGMRRIAREALAEFAAVRGET